MLGLTQRELAEASGIGRASIDRLERGLGGNTRVRDAVRKVLEARGIRFIEASKELAGGVLLPPDPETSTMLEATILE